MTLLFCNAKLHGYESLLVAIGTKYVHLNLLFCYAVLMHRDSFVGQHGGAYGQDLTFFIETGFT